MKSLCILADEIVESFSRNFQIIIDLVSNFSFHYNIGYSMHLIMMYK
jgi:hypothetical protein